MYFKYKKNIRHIIIIFSFFLSAFLGAQEYKIRYIVYEIDGITRDNALKDAVKIDTNIIFKDLQALDIYLAEIQLQLQNQRVLELALLTPTYDTPDDTNIIPVDLLITAKDSWNIIAVPYPKYSSNSGLEIKLRLKDFNFLGSMKELNGELSYIYDTVDDANDHKFRIGTSFGIPFTLGPVSSSWNNNLSLGYTVGNAYPTGNLTTGLSFDYPITDFFALKLGFNQSITYDPDPLYQAWGDSLYFGENVWFNMSILLAQTDFFGSIYWTPNISITYYWDQNGINPQNDDLIDTDIIFGHTLSFNRVNWIGNFRDGFWFSFSQSLHRETHKNQFYLSNSISVRYFKAFEQVQIASRLWFFENNGYIWEDISHVRGVRNNDINTDSALILNFDLPIKIWQTDWVGYGLWEFTNLVDFELQLSPFFDILIGKNYLAGTNGGSTNFSFKDGWYGAGLEILVFPKRWRGLQGRISVGIDVVKFAQKVGDKIEFVDTVVNKLFNTSWRKNTANWYEIEIGIGLFY